MADQPNGEWTKIPNAILDAVAQFSEAELRLLLVVARKTIGWQKECDLISLTQFEQLTGLSRPSVNATLKRLVANGYLEQAGKGKRGVNCYRLGTGLVNSVNQLTQATSKPSEPDLVNSVNQTSPRLVNSVNTQKKDSKERSKERETHAKTRAPPTDDLAYSHLAVITYKNYFKRWPSLADAKKIAAAAADFEMWSSVCELWKANRWDYLKIDNLISRYQKGNESNGTHPHSRHAAGRSRPAPIAERLDRDDE